MYSRIAKIRHKFHFQLTAINQKAQQIIKCRTITVDVFQDQVPSVVNVYIFMH
jgi:hypothetical protein